MNQLKASAVLNYVVIVLHLLAGWVLGFQTIGIELFVDK